MKILKKLGGRALSNIGKWHFLQNLNNIEKTTRPIPSLEKWLIEVEVVNAC